MKPQKEKRNPPQGITPNFWLREGPSNDEQTKGPNSVVAIRSIVTSVHLNLFLKSEQDHTYVTISSCYCNLFWTWKECQVHDPNWNSKLQFIVTYLSKVQKVWITILLPHIGTTTSVEKKMLRCVITSDLLRLSRDSQIQMLGLMPGHCRLRMHLNRIGIHDDSVM